MRRLLPLLVIAALAPAAVAQEALDPSRTVATVNGEEIKAGEYYRRIEWFRPDAGSSLATLPVGFQVLRQIISERMIVQLAKSKGVAPTAPEIDARVAETYKENPTLKADMAQSGTSDADLRAQIASQEAQFKLVTAGVTITDQELETHYKTYPSEFHEPARYRLRIVAVGDDAAQEKVDAALKAGRTFADVAREFSLDGTTKSLGGEYGEVPETALAEVTRKAIEVTPVGSTSVWIKSDKGARIKFYVEAVIPAKTLPLDAALKARLRRRLMLDKGSLKNKTDVGKELEAATRAAKVTIAQPQFQQYYTQLLERLKRTQG